MAFALNPEHSHSVPSSYRENFLCPNVSTETFRRLASQGQKSAFPPEDYTSPDFVFPFPPDSYQRVEAWVGQMEEWQQQILRVEHAFKKVTRLNGQLKETREEVDEILARFLRADWIIANAMAAEAISVADIHELDVLIDDWSEDMAYLFQVAVELEVLAS